MAAIRKVDFATGIISTVAGTREPGYSRDGGPGTLAQMREPNVCFLDDNGGLLIADIPDPRIRRLDLDTGIMTMFAGDGEKSTASRLPKRLSWAPAVCVDSKGNTYIAEREGNGVRKVDANGVMSTFADTGEPGYGGDGGPALAAAWGAPKAMRCDNRDDLIWWTLRTKQSGVSTLKPAPSLSSPAGIREATAAWSDRTAVSSTIRAIYTSLKASITE
jgi:hypothetical protein